MFQAIKNYFKADEHKCYPAPNWEAIAADNHRKFVQAAKQANVFEDAWLDAKASNQRLTDQLAAKTARLERIAEKFDGQSSGTAKLAVKLARGGA